MSFTAEEYRTAARVIRKEFEDKAELKTVPSASEILEEQAERIIARERYARGLIGVQIPSASAVYNGARILDRLLTDGWTPPEGLF